MNGMKVASVKFLKDDKIQVVSNEPLGIAMVAEFSPLFDCDGKDTGYCRYVIEGVTLDHLVKCLNEWNFIVIF